jgi:hypothetical protein
VTWFTPEQAMSESLSQEMEGGRGTLLRMAMAVMGRA